MAALWLANTALEAAANAIFITDLHGSIEYINPAFTLLTGYDASEAIGRQAKLVRSDVHGQAFYHDQKLNSRKNILQSNCYSHVE